MLSAKPSPLMKSTSSSSSLSMSAISTDIEDDEDDDNESDVSTTIIDGKRAISLSNFGKFTEQREKREGGGGFMMGPTFGYPLASAGFRALKSGFNTRMWKNV
ncbi:hypothetical protein BLA29_013931 [Euroglyphus maynei]|uniref:Uncharacterized protein n=1 Tax=Euroglyphus maynei TaxID=6958 RepID=A0A1Y3BJ58_EURMA|nr:hypothetical protein BLA29_013931 [Euroglyphus maynei]